MGFRVWGLGFGVLGFRVWGLGVIGLFRIRVLGLGFEVWGLGFGVRVWGSGFRVRALGFWVRLWGSGFQVWGFGFGVLCLGYGVLGVYRVQGLGFRVVSCVGLGFRLSVVSYLALCPKAWSRTRTSSKASVLGFRV